MDTYMCFADLNRKSKLLKSGFRCLKRKTKYACPVCISEAEADDMIITRCAHIFCRSCIMRIFMTLHILYPGLAYFTFRQCSCDLIRIQIAEFLSLVSQAGCEMHKSLRHWGLEHCQACFKTSFLLCMYYVLVLIELTKTRCFLSDAKYTVVPFQSFGWSWVHLVSCISVFWQGIVWCFRWHSSWPFLYIHEHSESSGY